MKNQLFKKLIVLAGAVTMLLSVIAGSISAAPISSADIDLSSYIFGSGNIAASKIWKIDENETYPYFEEMHPALSLNIQGNLKENHKFIINGTYTNSEFIAVKDVQITVKPLSGGASVDAIKIDPATETNVFKELIIKQAGEYQVTMTVNYLLGTKTETQSIIIEKDQASVAK